MIIISGSNQSLLISSSLDVNLDYSVFYVKKDGFHTSSSYGNITQKTGSYVIQNINDVIILKELQVYNYSTGSMSTGSSLVKIFLEKDSNRYLLHRGYLVGGETLSYTDDDGFNCKDINKAIKHDSLVGYVGWNYPGGDSFYTQAFGSTGLTSAQIFGLGYRHFPWKVTQITQSVMFTSFPNNYTSASLFIAEHPYGIPTSNNVTSTWTFNIDYIRDISSQLVTQSFFKIENISIDKNKIISTGFTINGASVGSMRTLSTSRQINPYYGRISLGSLANGFKPGACLVASVANGTNANEAIILPMYRNED